MTTIKPMQIAARVPHCPCNTALAFSSSIILASKFCIGTSIVDEIVKWVIANTERIISIVAIIASYFIGVYSNRRNDRRKEFNTVAEPMLVILEEHIERLKSGRKPQVTSIFCGSLFPQEILSALRRRMPEKQVNEMDKSVYGVDS